MEAIAYGGNRYRFYSVEVNILRNEKELRKLRLMFVSIHLRDNKIGPIYCLARNPQLSGSGSLLVLRYLNNRSFKNCPFSASIISS